MAADSIDDHRALLEQQIAHPAWLSALLIGTKRIPGPLIASQIASASFASRVPAKASTDRRGSW